MIVEPRVRGFICTSAHPVGCAESVAKQAQWAREHPLPNGPKSVLVLGSSMGYGLSSRITAAFSSGAATMGVFYERPATGKRTATAGWYNTVAFDRLAEADGLWTCSLNGDAFSDELKALATEKLREIAPVDMVVYSLAAPRRGIPGTDRVAKSVLKPIGETFYNRTLNTNTGEISDVTLTPATEAEVAETIEVMGGQDWALWVHALRDAGLLADRVTTVAYSYIGPELTHPIYRQGSIGQAKAHLERTGHELNTLLGKKGGRALVSVNKAVVTQSSSAIPVVPLYISILFQVMKRRGTHEGCTEQIVRMMQGLFEGAEVSWDENGRLRMDDWEMRKEVQEEVNNIWTQVNEGNLASLTDIEGYRKDFLELFGFGVEGVDYGASVEI